jgi:ribosomal-protein-alanine N-acetyltransferase
MRDRDEWLEVRSRNIAWLGPWEATSPQGLSTGINYGGMVRALRKQARMGQQLPFVMRFEGRLVGQITVAGITWGSLCSAHVGYWIDQAVAGRGIMPTAVALATDHCFGTVGLHRVEVNIRPENAASLRVVEKLGFRPEGTRKAFLHIDGEWRDHLAFALCTEEVPEGLMARWKASGGGLR